MRRLLFILVLFGTARCYAQSADTLVRYVGVTSSGTYNKTVNNSSYLLNNALRFGIKKHDLVMNANNRWLYGAQNDKLTNNDVSSLWDMNLYKTLPHFNYWALLNYTTAYSLKINHQVQGGVGIAYNIIDREALVINVSDGILYDYSDVIATDGPERYGTFRNSARLHVKWNIKDRVVFRGNCFFQPSLDYGNDYIVKADASLALRLKKWLSLTSAFNYNKMTRTGAENLFITYGLSIERRF